MMNHRNPKLPPKPGQKTVLAASPAQYDQFLFDSSAVNKNTEVKSTIEIVMKEQFLDKAHRKFHDNEDEMNEVVDTFCTEKVEAVNVEGVPRTIYLNSDLSQRTLAKVRDQIRVN